MYEESLSLNMVGEEMLMEFIMPWKLCFPIFIG
jgi:hypothetical protein